MKPTRSLLFVPGHKQGWAAKAVAAGADAVILDLEDSVPVDMKADARGMVAETIKDLARNSPHFTGRAIGGPRIAQLLVGRGGGIVGPQIHADAVAAGEGGEQHLKFQHRLRQRGGRRAKLACEPGQALAIGGLSVRMARLTPGTRWCFASSTT